jgi:hypothetical protein
LLRATDNKGGEAKTLDRSRAQQHLPRIFVGFPKHRYHYRNNRIK